MKSTFKKFMAMMLAVLMVAGSFSTLVFADDNSTAGDEGVEEHVCSEFVELDPVEPTCTTAGYQLKKCVECGETTEIEGSIKLPLGHAEYVWSEANGKGAYHCSRCMEILVIDGEEVWYDGTIQHKYEYSKIEQPTCYAPGKVILICKGNDTKCDCTEADPSTKELTIAKLEHNYVETGRDEQTCDPATEEFIYYACKYCGHEKTEELGKLGHTYGEPTADEICACITHNYCTVCGYDNKEEAHGEKGEIEYTYFEGEENDPSDNKCIATYDKCVDCDCSECDFVRDESLDAHQNLKYETVEATCTKWGSKYRYCDACGYQEIVEHIKPTGHTYEIDLDATVFATCSAPGTLVKKCACGDVVIVELEQRTHVWDEGVYTEATCISNAYTTHTCTNVAIDDEGNVVLDKDGKPIPVCDEQWVEEHERKPEDDNRHDPHGYHRTTAPTCISDGMATLTCSYCGKNNVKVTLENLHEHPNYQKLIDDAEKNEATKGEKNPYRLEKLGHDMGEEPVVLQEATCINIGITQWQCHRCDYAEAVVYGEKDPTNHAAPWEPVPALMGDDRVAVKDASGEVIKTYYRTPTCDADGVLYLYCPACEQTDTSFNDEGTALGQEHQWDNGTVISPAVNATCTTNGKTAQIQYKCTHKIYQSSYQYVQNEQTGEYEWKWIVEEILCPGHKTEGGDPITAGGHDWDIVTEEVLPDCYTVGYTRGLACKNCDAEIEAKELIVEHQMQHFDEVPVGCINPGKAEHSVCVQVKYEFDFDDEEHPEGKLVVVKKDGQPVDAECSYTVDADNNPVEDPSTLVIPATGHNFAKGPYVVNGKIELIYCDSYKAPTCTEAGQSYGSVCVNEWCDGGHDDGCGSFCQHDVIPAFGHKYVTGNIGPLDCTTPAVVYTFCEYCGETRDGKGNVESYTHPYGHDMKSTEFPADCLNPGYTADACQNGCGYIDESTKVETEPALGHDLDCGDHPADIAEAFCKRCQQMVDAHYGNWVDVEVYGGRQILEKDDPDYEEKCIEYTLIVKYCSECNASFNDRVEAAKVDHNLVKVEDKCVPSTFTQEGKDVYACDCGYVKEENLGLKTGIEFDYAINSWNANGLPMAGKAVNGGYIAITVDLNAAAAQEGKEAVEMWGTTLAFYFDATKLEFDADKSSGIAGYEHKFEAVDNKVMIFSNVPQAQGLTNAELDGPQDGFLTLVFKVKANAFTGVNGSTFDVSFRLDEANCNVVKYVDLEDGTKDITVVGADFRNNDTEVIGSITISKMGQLDGDDKIDAKDAALMQTWILSGINDERADIDGDSYVTPADFTLLKDMILAEGLYDDDGARDDAYAEIIENSYGKVVA